MLDSEFFFRNTYENKPSKDSFCPTKIFILILNIQFLSNLNNFEKK